MACTDKRMVLSHAENLQKEKKEFYTCQPMWNDSAGTG